MILFEQVIKRDHNIELKTVNIFILFEPFLSGMTRLKKHILSWMIRLNKNILSVVIQLNKMFLSRMIRMT